MSSANQLRDIHLPPEISWWPPAAGWWLVLAVLVVLIIYLGYLSWKHFSYFLPANTALARLEKLMAGLTDNLPPQQALIELSVVLRRTALAYYPRERVAGLHGQSWLTFLNTTTPTPCFNNLDSLIIAGPYQSTCTKQAATRALTASIAWVKLMRKQSLRKT